MQELLKSYAVYDLLHQRRSARARSFFRLLGSSHVGYLLYDIYWCPNVPLAMAILSRNLSLLLLTVLLLLDWIFLTMQAAVYH